MHEDASLLGMLHILHAVLVLFLLYVAIRLFYMTISPKNIEAMKSTMYVAFNKLQPGWVILAFGLLVFVITHLVEALMNLRYLPHSDFTHAILDIFSLAVISAGALLQLRVFEKYTRSEFLRA